MVDRSAVQKPTLPQEVVPVPEWGDVVVRGLDLAQRMHLSSRFKDKADKASGKFAHMAALLEVSVLADDGEPLFTLHEWNVWGINHQEDFLRLWDAAWRLSDMDGKEAEKNSKAPTSD